MGASVDEMTMSAPASSAASRSNPTPRPPTRSASSPYTDKRCYGMSDAEIGSDKPKRGDQTLQKDEIQALADYVAAKIIGKPAVTKEECIEYFGSEINECRLVAGRQG